MAAVRGYQQQNLRRLLDGMRVHVKGVIKPQLLMILQLKASALASYIDSGAGIPEYTSNLHDATGVGVYAYGAMFAFIPTKRAKKKTSSGFDGNHYQIDGNAFLTQAISEAQGRFGKGIWFVVFSAVPYAYHIDLKGSPLGRGKDFFKTLRTTAIDDILAGLRPISKSVTTEMTQV